MRTLGALALMALILLGMWWIVNVAWAPPYPTWPLGI
jgi:hypothetical protein